MKVGSDLDSYALGRPVGAIVGDAQPLAQRVHDHQRKGRLLANQLDKTGVVDPHHAGADRGRDRGGRARRAVDDRHLAEELALAERHDDGLAATIDLGDLDFAVEHDKELPARRAFLENDITNAVFVDALLDGHGVSRLVPVVHVNRELAWRKRGLRTDLPLPRGSKEPVLGPGTALPVPSSRPKIAPSKFLKFR